MDKLKNLVFPNQSLSWITFTHLILTKNSIIISITHQAFILTNTTKGFKLTTLRILTNTTKPWFVPTQRDSIVI